MVQHGLKQKELVDVFGTPSIVSEVLSGKRDLNKEHISRLSKRFRVSAGTLFLSRLASALQSRVDAAAQIISRLPRRGVGKIISPRSDKHDQVGGDATGFG
jgi:transcriptional regulator with XRE-family HTH domain